MRALGFITSWSETFKNKDDKIESGDKLSNVYYNMSGSFLLFRGAPMKEEWVHPYIEKVGKEVV